MKNIVNIAAYKFVSLAEAALPDLRVALKDETLACDLKGTILLSAEGINCFLAGTRENIDCFKSFLEKHSFFSGLTYKESFSDYQPFSRMLVRLKKEVISMGYPEVQPEKKTAPHLAPEVFKRWYDEEKEMIVLDTRNDFEVALGTFDQALDLDIQTFRAFPEVVTLLPDSVKEKPVVTFCTGGIRCEKAAQYMLDHGFKEVYQLEGGILNYFEKCGGEYYHGECFVFDKRVALDASLNETGTVQCYGCRHVLPVEEQGKPCSACGSEMVG